MFAVPVDDGFCRSGRYSQHASGNRLGQFFGAGAAIAAMLVRILFALLFLPLAAFGHVGSPDVYYEGYAGPYHLLVTVRPPLVIPGLAEIEIRSISSDVTQIQVAPMRLVGAGAKTAPTPDAAQRSASDPQLFIGKLWIMARGSWKVQLDVEGPQGKGELAVPIAAVSLPASTTMHRSLGGLLAGLGLVLVVGLVGIIRAANREAALDPGLVPSLSQRRRAFVITVIAAILLAGALVFGDLWWRADASQTAKLSYKVPHLQLTLNQNILQLGLENPNNVEWRQFRSELEDPDRLRLDDLIPDHGHLMHLFLVRVPDMKSFWHLHPEQINGAKFSQLLPRLPAGHYRIFADIVHHTGFPETQVGDIEFPDINGAALVGDDAGDADLRASDRICQLSDGYRMIWERDSVPLTTDRPIWFRFRIEGKDGEPAALEHYMGMAGHAAFIRDDGQVFAHVHPSGSVSMAAAELAQNNGSIMEHRSDMAETIGTPPTSSIGDMNGMTVYRSSAEVSFPYGFPQPGNYHVFIQVKLRGKIETAAFRAYVER